MLSLLLMITFFCFFTTEAYVLNKIAGVLKHAPDKVGAGGCGKTADNDE